MNLVKCFFRGCALTFGSLISACGGGDGGGGESGRNNSPPVANSSPTATVVAPTRAIAFGKVNLDGSLSTDADGHVTRYQWRQISGPAITIVEGLSGSAHFIAPEQAGTVRVTLTVTDDRGGTGSAEADISVVAASEEQTQVTFVSSRLLTGLAEATHTDHAELLSAPLVGSALLMQATVTGPVDEDTRFSIVDQDGNEVSPVSMQLISDPAVQPSTFAGEFEVPTRPFSVRATGRSRRLQEFAITAAERFTPTRIRAQFEPEVFSGRVDSSAPLRLSLTNNGAADQYTLHFVDPAGVIRPTPDIIRTLQLGETVWFDFQSTVPPTLAAYETLTVEITNRAGDRAVVRAQVWQELAR